MEALRNWAASDVPSESDEPFFGSHEEYEAEVQRCENERKEFEEKIRKILGQENTVAIKQVHAEFFTAIKIEEMDNK